MSSGRAKCASVRHEDGKEYPLATLGKGETFGEKSLLMRQEQLATAISTQTPFCW